MTAPADLGPLAELAALADELRRSAAETARLGDAVRLEIVRLVAAGLVCDAPRRIGPLPLPSGFDLPSLDLAPERVAYPGGLEPLPPPPPADGGPPTPPSAPREAPAVDAPPDPAPSAVVAIEGPTGRRARALARYGILRLLTDGPRTAPWLAGATGHSTSRINTLIHNAESQRLVEAPVVRVRPLLWSITDEGRAWLARFELVLADESAS